MMLEARLSSIYLPLIIPLINVCAIYAVAIVLMADIRCLVKSLGLNVHGIIPCCGSDIMSGGLHPIVPKPSTLRFISSADGVNLLPRHP
jgi:hypothetical protein